MDGGCSHTGGSADWMKGRDHARQLSMGSHHVKLCNVGGVWLRWVVWGKWPHVRRKTTWIHVWWIAMPTRVVKRWLVSVQG